MLTQDQVKEAIKAGRKSGCEVIDSRDYARLTAFFPVEDWPLFGFKLKEGETADPVRPWTYQSVMECVASDLEFSFEKALNQRSISASLMYEVMLMWMWVMEENDLANRNNTPYPQYGLPLFKKIAVRFGLPNPICDDNGDEEKWGCEEK